ncbi:hypothetical protein C0995_014130 [Termitomyces sp. Mi166|nr:hypothetical protein C0995_014130 [Termitomyces sp. Mi166\
MVPTAHTYTHAPASTSLKRTEDDEVRPYVIVGDIGKGSFATVYKGYHEETRQQVAIKTVKRDNLTAKLFDNLKSEIQILKSLSHRHITRLIDIVLIKYINLLKKKRAERHIYLIMEYCDGGDLTNYIKKRGRVEGLEYAPSPGAALQYYPHPRTGGLDEIVVRSFLRQLARALKFLRHRNLIHRDIKPQNLLLNAPSPDELARGHPLGVPILKVADFGFARSLPNAMMAETLCGSPLYMAPEILRYEKYDAKADLWSVGAVLYEMSVGKPPFRARNHIELLKKIEQSRGVRWPDEDPALAAKHANTNGAKNGHGSGGGTGAGDEPTRVPEDIKMLVRVLLKRNPVERATFDEFFGSEALANSRFPRVQTSGVSRGAVGGVGGLVAIGIPCGVGQGSGSGSRGVGVGVGAGIGVGVGGGGVVGGGGAGAGAGGSGRDEGWMGGRPATPEHHRIIPPEVLDMNAMIPPSRFNFRRGGGVGAGEGPGQGLPVGMEPEGESGTARERERGGRRGSAGSSNANTSPHPHLNPHTTPHPYLNTNLNPHTKTRHPKPLSTEGSFIPGETEEDGMLRREYVLVGDGRAVDVCRTVDEINAEPRRPLYERKIPPTPTTDDLAPFEQTAGTSSSPSNTSNKSNLTTLNTTPSTTAPITFPPPPLTSHPPASPLSSSPSSIASRTASNALNRALSLASKKLFGGRTGVGTASSPPRQAQIQQGQGSGMANVMGGSGSGSGMGTTNGMGGSGTGSRTGSVPSSPRRAPIIVNTVEERERDPLEEEMLKELEELAQKTDVLTRWADEMYEYVKAVPQSAFLSFLFFSPFSLFFLFSTLTLLKNERIADDIVEPLSDPTKFTPREGEGDRHAKRRQLQVMEAEYNAVTCVAVYMLLMSFSQKGINRLRNHQEHMKMRYPEGRKEELMCILGHVALMWFKDHFIKCNDRAALVKTWLPAQYDGPKSWLDQLVYDRALVLSRTAARKELLDSANSPDECEKLYEESLWCLYALQDDLLQVGNPFLEEDRETIATWIKRTKLRLVRCRARMNMNDRDRINDARADQNLADVARIPAPWDVKPAQDTTKRTP